MCRAPPPRLLALAAAKAKPLIRWLACLAQWPRLRLQGVCGGLGNRIVNIVAAFALAILTDRAFIVDYPGSSPLELETFARSDLIDWRMPAWFEHAPFSEGSATAGIFHDRIAGTVPIVEERRAFNKQVRAVQAH